MDERRVADAMITCPEIHGPSTTVGQLRTFFHDDHVHAALLVESGRLIAFVERADLQQEFSDSAPAQTIATVDGRTIRPDASLTDAFAVMTRSGRRRLAVTTDSSTLVGLLCLKASGLGFCSNADVSSRKRCLR